MEDLQYIRSYFKPIQPSIKVGEGNVSYKEFEPREQLKNYIHCYWLLKTDQKLDSPFDYRVVSDGCIDIFFNLNNLSESFIMGFCKKYTSFPIGNEFSYAGTRFYPSIFPQIFSIPANILSNKFQLLEPLLPQLFASKSREIKEEFDDSIPKLDNLFESVILEKKLKVDNRFQNAFFEILKRNGHLETESDLNIGLSPRQLRRLFNYYIGTTPKSFCQVVRFQYILNAKPSSQSLKENKIFYDVGFYDQAHFIKNFTRFYGVTPTKAFK